MALVVESAAGFADRFWKEESSPVGDATDDAATVKDEITRCFGNATLSVRRL